MAITLATINGNEYEVASIEDLTGHPDYGHAYTKKYNLVDYMRPNKRDPRYTELWERVPTDEGVVTFVQKQTPTAGGAVITDFPTVEFGGTDEEAPAEGSTPDGVGAENTV